MTAQLPPEKSALQLPHVTDMMGNEALFKVIAEDSPIGIYHADANGHCTYTNPHWREIYGLSLEQSFGRAWADVIHPADRQVFFNELSQSAQCDGSFSMEYRLLKAGGEVVYVHALARAVSWGSPPQRGFVGAVEDVTLRKGIEAQLRDSNSFLDRAERIAGVGGWEVDLRTQVVKWSDQNKRIFDLPLDFQPTFEGHLAFFGSEGQRIIEQTANQAIRTGLPWDLELPMRTTTGRQVWTRSVGVVEYEDGQPARLVGALQDITARKTAELELHDANRLLKAVLENLPGGLSVFNSELQLQAHNPQFRQLLDLPETLFAGDVTTFESIIRHNALRGDYGSGPTEPTIAAIVERARSPISHHFKRALPTGKVIDIRGAPMPGGGFVTTYVDVSAVEAAAVELQKAKDAAVAANHAKSNFLTTMSHEIRTPLNGILGITQLLLDEPLNARQYQFARLIDNSAQSLLVLVNDFLDLAKIDAGKTVLEQVPFNLSRLLADVTDLFAYRASAKSLVFSKHVAQGVPQWVWGDPSRLRQILTNLLSNALKFTEAGAVQLTVHANAAGVDAVNLVFAITDSGIGIAHDMQSQVFANFVQADASTTRRYGGTGLGLSIVKQLTELMGGRIDLQSAPGQGSTFRVMLDAVRLAVEPTFMASGVHAEQGVCKQHGRILVVEDNPTNQIVAVGMLKKLGFENVTVASDGQQAVQRASNNDFSAILMDCQMPIMDGYLAAQALRANACQTPIIAMTANASEADAARCVAAGMNDYIAKPVTRGSLQEALMRWIPTLPAAHPAPLAEQGHPMIAHDLPVHDRPQALGRLGGDAELLDVVLASFKVQMPVILADLENALQTGDNNLLARHLHSLLGSSSAVSATQIHALLVELNESIAQGNVYLVRHSIPALKHYFALFVTATE